jgi:hypothetical protein
MSQYFSDREKGARPRINEEISESSWGGIISVINARIADSSFGYRYPLACPDGRGPCGCDEHIFYLALKADIPEIELPLNVYNLPPTFAVLDVLEFCYRAVGKPISIDFHTYFGHNHFSFDPEEGKADFINDINRILARNGMTYELSPDGIVTRIAPPVLRDALLSAIFQTGDAELDSLFEISRKKFLDPNIEVRIEAVEKLWDAWERFKTIEPGKDKKASTQAILDKVTSEPNFRKVIEQEALELTRIGNAFKIRHSEVTKTPLETSEHVDYLFHRLFALIRLLLCSTGRGG